MEEVIKTNVGKVGTGSTSVDGEELMWGSQPRLDAKVLPNPNYVLNSDAIGKDTNESSFLQDPSQSGGGQVDGVSSWLINKTTIETLFGVKFTSLSDIDVFTNSIKEGLYADILSMMSTSDSHVIRKDPTLPSDPIVQSVDLITKSTSYVGAAGASTKEQPKVSSNFRPLVANLVFNGVNISIPRKVVKKVNSEADLVDVVSIGIPSLTGDEFTTETIRVEYEWRPLMCKKKKRKGKSKSTNGGQFASPYIKQTVRYEPKVTPSAPKKGANNVRNLSKLSSILKTTDASPKKDNFTMFILSLL
uniref:Zinc knuckle CX2CX4HX4C n=1 Tax=Tanacetum cinerariifolium TaxID=118510 RepID=A0A699J5M7_TANCI|nr:zinc knuckle CX2CX4HX4C [Tanacetum cinerariifolium]